MLLGAAKMLKAREASIKGTVSPTSPPSGIKVPFSVPFMCTAGRQNLATCGTNPRTRQQSPNPKPETRNRYPKPETLNPKL